MKFKSKKDWFGLTTRILGIIGCLAIICVGFKFYIEFVGSMSMQIVFFLLIFVAGLVGWKFLLVPLFKNYYEFGENELILVEGKNEDKIEYKCILKIERSKKPFTKHTICLNKINIVYLDEGVRKSIYASPENEEEFVKQLKIRCHSMKNAL